jgi:hypothetical protein
VLVLAGAALELQQHSPRLPISKQAAIRAVLRDPTSVRALRSSDWNHAALDAVDGRLVRVTFSDGGRIVFEAAVQPSGAVSLTSDFAHRAVPYGNALAYEPAVLIGLSLVFIVMAAVVPLARLRNLDVLALLSFLASVLLLQHRYVGGSVLAALPGSGYLIVRCLWAGLGPPRAAGPATPLYLSLTSRWDAREQTRVLQMLLAALMLVFIAVGVSSPGAVDVIYGVMEGATKLVHGVLPYGHLPGDVVHGDTYPLLSYLLYTPIALLHPVGSTWDSVDGALAATVLVAVITAVVLLRGASAGQRRDQSQKNSIDADPATPHAGGPQSAGLLAALTWLSFPPLLITVSTGTTDVVLAGMLAIAVVLWRKPMASSAVLACAGWFKLAPFALIPIWLAPLRGRRLLAAVGVVLTVSGAMMAAVIALGGIGGVATMVHAVGFQFQRGSLQSPWEALGLTGLQPVGQACVLAMIAGAAFRLHRAPELFAERTRVAALSAAVLLGLQLAADYWAFLYLVWIVPLVGISLLAAPVTPAQHAPELAGRGRIPRLAIGSA